MTLGYLLTNNFFQSSVNRGVEEIKLFIEATPYAKTINHSFVSDVLAIELEPLLHSYKRQIEFIESTDVTNKTDSEINSMLERHIKAVKTLQLLTEIREYLKLTATYIPTLEYEVEYQMFQKEHAQKMINIQNEAIQSDEAYFKTLIKTLEKKWRSSATS